ncbi:MAG: DUF5017 domain-containing protein [Pedobacter sp.]|nr:DUF5017 domain-containing protein [Pedobacter sp.]MDQ8052239.1 DUF5017 domain-containing protein [Pedobacter sp.]
MKLKYYQIFAGLLLLGSCKNDFLAEVKEPTLEVSSPKTTYKVGDVIDFNISGESDIITFYSGEPQSEFAYRDSHVVDVSSAGVNMNFNIAATGNATSQGTLNATTPPQLTVWASTDLNDDYTPAGVQKATWVDITSRFKYATTATFISASPTVGGVSVNDLIKPGKPLYIGFRHETKPQAVAPPVGGITRSWLFEAFSMTSQKNISTNPNATWMPQFYNLQQAGFRLVDMYGKAAPSRSLINATRLTLLGNLYDAVNDPGNDPNTVNWGITRGMYFDKVDLGGDKGIALKDQAKDAALTNYSYTYTTPGIYKATFVATTNNATHRKEVVREITITINP